jgi:hypothetical protein
MFQSRALTEREWYEGVDPLRMINHVSDGASDRKLRLFAVACCRLDASGDALLLQAADLAERHAEGRADLEAPTGEDEPSVLRPSALDAAWESVASSDESRQTRLAGLLRELFGNPFRPTKVEDAWLHWRGGLLRAMARDIHDERRFTDLPILGDALEDAGCVDTNLLAHCRQSDGHVPGCWAVDLLAGLE